MNTDNLLTFLSVCRHRSYTVAGKELGLSQSAVWRQVRKLEADLGTANTTCAVSEVEINRLMAENTALAERLTTAQIARLEAERILLEESIERIQVEALVNGTKPGTKVTKTKTTQTESTDSTDSTKGTKQ